MSQAFLVFKDTPVSDWQKVLRETRTDYAEHRDRLLRFIKHPEELAKLAVDPLADDPNVSSCERRSLAFESADEARAVALGHGASR